MDQALAFFQGDNAAQMDDAAFVNALKGWIRFGSNTAFQKGDGLSALGAVLSDLRRQRRACVMRRALDEVII